jgi:putative tryptophan/tyrosine transport system substrate-binding protein
VKRRAVLAAGLAVAIGQPTGVRAQDSTRARRIGVVMNTPEKDPEGQARRSALVQGLKDLGWVEGRNLRIEVRWGANDAARYRKAAEEFAAWPAEVIVAGGGTNTVRAVQQVIGTIPIVFTSATDPVGGGLVASLARPGGNVTGLMQREFSLGAKSLELLKQLAPKVTRVAVLRDPTSTGGVGQFGAIQAVAPGFKVALTPVDVRTAAEIERGLAAFARAPNGGMIVTTSAPTTLHRKLIVALASQHRLPAVYAQDYMVDDGGLASYGPDEAEAYRAVAAYVNRILKGEKPADLPVEQPSKVELVLNLKAARAIGLTIPQSLLQRADRVVE